MPRSRKVTLPQFFNYCFENNLPVALYSLPGQKQATVIAQKSTELHPILFEKKTVRKKGFLFAPFATTGKYQQILIRPEIFCTETNLPPLNFFSAPVHIKQVEDTIQQTGKADFKKMVKQAQQKIKTNRWEKIVVSGIIKKSKPKQFCPASYFKAVCEAYPNAFKSLVFTPKYGLWIGATPEILLSVKNKKLTTYSLAGTKTNANQKWSNKELEEQKLVSNYIFSILTKNTSESITVTGPKTIEAGNLFHLRTLFSQNNFRVSDWQHLTGLLHPTPAVGGVPKQEAIEFILHHETAPRQFYTGYLGPVNIDKQIHLYVNIRCMQVLKKSLAIYVGCGITASSEPEKEWNEAIHKSKTLLNILKQKI